MQIRPWNLSDSDFVMDGSQPLDPRKTIFVGGVPRPLRAGEYKENVGHVVAASRLSRKDDKRYMVYVKEQKVYPVSSKDHSSLSKSVVSSCLQNTNCEHFLSFI